MKFLFVGSEYLPDSGGGIITYYRELLPHLVEAGHTVDVLVARPDRLDIPDRQMGGVRIRYLTRDSVRHFDKKFERFATEFQTLHTFLPLAWAAYEASGKGERYDLVETTDWQLLFLPWVISRVAPPVAVALHGSCGQVDWFEKSAVNRMNGDMVRLVEQAAIKVAAGAYAYSETNARFWGRQSGRTIPVLPPIFRQATPSPASPRQQPENTGVVVGRLQSWKGPQVLCDALRLAPSVAVRWIGSDTPHPETNETTAQWLRRSYRDIFGIRLLPVQPVANQEVMRQIAAAKFLCVPSIWDVFNLTALEAMSAGTPVICSQAAGAEMLIRHGENGFLFDPGHPAQLAECLKEVLGMSGQRRSQITANAVQTLQHFLNPETLLRDRLKFYRELSNKNAAVVSDRWLEAALYPETAGYHRDEVLKTFTSKQLATAAASGVWRGLRRRFGGPLSKGI
jgi:glycosyltransferase involved in cell wall biosynthesis